MANLDALLGPRITPQEAELTAQLSSLMIVSTVLSFPLSLFDSYVLVQERFVFQRTLALMRQVIGPSLYVLALYAGSRSLGLVVVSVSLSILSGIITMIYCFIKLEMKISVSRLRVSDLSTVVIFSSYVFVNMLVDQVNWNADRFILARYRGSETVATYSLGAQLNLMYMMLSTTVSAIFAPQVNSIAARTSGRDELDALFVRTGRIQFSVLSLVLVGYAILGREFMRAWVGTDYVDSYAVTLALIAPATVALIQNVGLEIQKALNLHQFRTKVLALGAVVNVALSVMVVESLGAFGVAAVTGISVLVFNGVIMNWSYSKRLDLNMRRFWMAILSLSRAPVAGALVGVTVTLVADTGTVGGFLICGTAIALTHVLVLWSSCLNANEKAAFLSVLPGFGR